MNKPVAEPEGSDRPLGRRERKALAAKRALLEAGLQAFERRPIAVVSVLDITEAADVAKGAFYLHFGSKDEYLLALWQEAQGRFLRRVRDAVEPLKSARERRKAVIGAFAKVAETHPEAVAFLMRMSSFLSDEIGPPGELLSIRRKYLAELAELIGPVEAGVSAMEIARVIDALSWGLIRQDLRLEQPPRSPDELIAIVSPAVEAHVKRLRTDGPTKAGGA